MSARQQLVKLPDGTLKGALMKQPSMVVIPQMRYLAIATITIALVIAFAFGSLIVTARSEPQQTRVYDSRGNSVGTVVPQGDGSVRYYDARGNSLGTSTTNSTGTTTFYGPGGNFTGRAVAPSSSRGR
jgi:hypothetical protein